MHPPNPCTDGHRNKVLVALSSPSSPVGAVRCPARIRGKINFLNFYTVIEDCCYLVIHLAFLETRNFVPDMSGLVQIVNPERAAPIREEFRLASLDYDDVKDTAPIVA